MDKTSDDERRQVEAIAEAIFEAIADPVFVIDFEGDGLGDHFRYVNEAACRLLNRSRAELQAMRPGTIDEIPKSVMEEAYQRLVTEGRATFETLMIAADGHRIPMEIHASDARLSDQRVCIAVARSLVARKEIARKLEEAKEAAEAANRAKSEFLATMSHEIRTPLHGVIGFASLLDGADVPGRIREAIDGIRDSANHLLALVTDVLDFSQIEAGRLELQPGPLDLTAQLKRIASAFRLRAQEKGLTFSYLENAGMPSLLWVDSLRIEQVLGNLLGNALKFTERGTITLEIRAMPEITADTYRISFAVSDTGIGIPADQLPRLFNRFSQVDASPSRRHEGSGLGLVIVRKLCEFMGGTATVESEFGVGSVFTASLVARSLEKPQASLISNTGPALADQARPFRILVAEDNALNRKLMDRMIARLGGAASFAIDGREAVAMAEKGGYDLILMDVNMPGVSGLDATRAIRSAEQMKAAPRSWIVALTAGVSEEERRACGEAGMDDFLGKPFTEEGLREATKRAKIGRGDG